MVHHMRFLLIENNEKLSSSVMQNFAMDDCVIDRVSGLRQANKYLDVTPYDLILLDLTLSKDKGRSFFTRDSKGNINTPPVIALLAKNQMSELEYMLDSGAADYIASPFDNRELRARCRIVLRRYGRDSQNDFVFGDLNFDLSNASISINGQVTRLRHKERQLLEIFFLAPERVISKQSLLDRMFPSDVEISENALEVYVGRLRKKISPSNLKIETMRNIGYKLTRNESKPVKESQQ